MIVWINGAFGSGKTQTTYELNRRVSNSFVFDPENAGLYIRKNIPKQIYLEDFQDYPMWREFNLSMLRYISKEYEGIILVPMTLANPEYFKEIVEALRNDGILVKHFVLSASKETILRRLRSRGEGKNSWAAKQIDRCIEGFTNEVFKDHIVTDNLSIDEVVEKIATAAKLDLLKDERRNLKKKVDRFKTMVKNIRI